ncbi:MAG: FkbM family methyltransferase [Ignavibacteria bacterium]|nr:FkbM family methyltransferase [Ignavibacteria bacterium]
MLNLLIKGIKFFKFGGFKYYLKGISLASYNNLYQLKKLGLNFDTIIDVGANRGQFAYSSRTLFPEAKIYSFEPTKSVFTELTKKMENDENFTALNMALGYNEGEIDFSEYENSLINSVYKSVDTEIKNVYKVKMNTLDNMISSKQINAVGKILLKLDVQGFELEVLKGSNESLKLVDYILIEVSTKKYYENMIMYGEVDEFLISNGFIQNKILDLMFDNLEITQLDILYKRKS